MCAALLRVNNFLVGDVWFEWGVACGVDYGREESEESEEFHYDFGL